MPQARIQNFLDDQRLLNAGQAEQINTLRTLIRALAPDIREELKYGGLLFSITHAVCGIFPYRAHISLGFSRGAELTDVIGLLEGSGNQRRHIKFQAGKPLNTEHVTQLLQQALVLERNTLS